MNELEQARQEINAIDAKMAALFEERMKQVEAVAKYKIANALPTLDSSREEEVVARNSRLIQDPVLREYYVSFLKDLMRTSRSYQGRLMQGMKVSFSGVPGAFAYIAAKKLFPDAELLAFPDFEDAYAACEDSRTDAVILPVENSFAGDVGSVMDLAFFGSLHINMMLNLDVTQNLLGAKGAGKKDIKTVMSHPQALSQCSAYIRDNGWQVIEESNTAIAASKVAESGDKSLGAIASAETAAIYGLDILESKVNTSGSNSTRFAVFSRIAATPAALGGGEHFILVFTVPNEAGALAKILNIIGAHGFNMSNLHSRPLKGMNWNYYFFAELEGSAASEDGQDLLRQLSTVCDKLKLVGTYRYL